SRTERAIRLRTPARRAPRWLDRVQRTPRQVGRQRTGGHGTPRHSPVAGRTKPDGVDLPADLLAAYERDNFRAVYHLQRHSGGRPRAMLSGPGTEPGNGELRVVIRAAGAVATDRAWRGPSGTLARRRRQAVRQFHERAERPSLEPIHVAWARPHDPL